MNSKWKTMWNTFVFRKARALTCFCAVITELKLFLRLFCECFACRIISLCNYSQWCLAKLCVCWWNFGCFEPISHGFALRFGRVHTKCRAKNDRISIELPFQERCHPCSAHRGTVWPNRHDARCSFSSHMIWASRDLLRSDQLWFAVLVNSIECLCPRM